jgi:serine protease Do
MSSVAPAKKTFSSIIFSSVASIFLVALLNGISAQALAAPLSALPDFTELVEKSGAAVVNIRTTSKIKPNQGVYPDEDEMQEYFRHFFSVPAVPRQDRLKSAKPAPQQIEEEVPRGFGSGFLISTDGYILTNAHVVDGADDVYVALSDKREFKAKLVGADMSTDVALLKIDANNLPRLLLGDSSKIKVGEWVIAMGSPLGFESNVTAGIISAKVRDIGDFSPFIQTDVAVNPGNSGGPLLNIRGEVIGITSRVIGGRGGYTGISLAVPIDDAMRITEQLKATGKVTRGRIGVQLGDVTKDIAESLGLPKAQGAYVQQVVPDSPAEKGGMEPGDIILKFNGTAIDKPADLRRHVGNTKPGVQALLSIWRKGVSRELSVTVAEVEVDNYANYHKKDERKSKQILIPNAIGMMVNNLLGAQRKELNIESGGVFVEAVEGVAAHAGLRPGDVILQMNNVDVKDAKQFNAMAAKLEPNKIVALLVRRGDTSLFVPLRRSGP